jgi:hypothetical protein
MACRVSNPQSGAAGIGNNIRTGPSMCIGTHAQYGEFLSNVQTTGVPTIFEKAIEGHGRQGTTRVRDIPPTKHDGTDREKLSGTTI